MAKKQVKVVNKKSAKAPPQKGSKNTKGDTKKEPPVDKGSSSLEKKPKTSPMTKRVPLPDVSKKSLTAEGWKRLMTGTKK